MVDAFNVIVEALTQRQGALPAEQLAYAGEKLGQSLNTGSAKSYSQGLIRAVEQIQGQEAVTAENAMGLVQALLGSSGDALVSQPETRGKTTGGSGLSTLLNTLGTLLGGEKPKSKS